MRVQFDFTRDGRRLRSRYVVIYRYRDGLIGQQELYYGRWHRFGVRWESSLLGRSVRRWTSPPERATCRLDMNRPVARFSLGISGSLVLMAALAVAVSCGRTSEARRVADRFMTLYYDDSHVPDALGLCTGTAKARLEFEIKFMKGTPTPKDEPPATFQLRGEKSPTRNEATYVYEVHLGKPGARVVFARLILVRADGHWLVSNFEEKVRRSDAAAKAPEQ